MRARSLPGVLASALLAVGSAGCCNPLFEVWSQGGWSFQVVKTPPHFGAPPLDARGFFDADTCRPACNGATTCYPTTLRALDREHPRRKVDCAMARDTPRRGVPSELSHTVELLPDQEIATTIGPNGEIDHPTCAALCEESAERRRYDIDAAHVVSCVAEPPAPIAGADEVFLVCGHYSPPHCANTSVFGS